MRGGIHVQPDAPPEVRLPDFGAIQHRLRTKKWRYACVSRRPSIPTTGFEGFNAFISQGFK
jgi:hypothetical protein